MRNTIFGLSLLLFASILPAVAAGQTQSKEIPGFTNLAWFGGGLDQITVDCDEINGNLIYSSDEGVAVLHQLSACYDGVMDSRRSSREMWKLVVFERYFKVYCDAKRYNLIYRHQGSISVVHQPSTCGAVKKEE